MAKIKSQPGKANDIFFDLALSFKCAGMSFQEIEETLYAGADTPEVHTIGWRKYEQSSDICSGLEKRRENSDLDD